jgi:NAD-dependent dihydropyrimidine dehydrogenase PreA subunit
VRMKRSRGKIWSEGKGMWGRRRDHLARFGRRPFNGRMTKGMPPSPSTYTSIIFLSPERTRSANERENEIEGLKRQARAVEARLRSIERRTGALAGEATISDYQVFVDSDQCIACGICREVCPVGAIFIEEIAVVDSDSCTGCRLCIDQCPRGALRLS